METAFFTEFFTEMRPSIVRFIRARLPLDIAEDLANETMLTVWRKNLPPPSNDVELRQRRTLTYLIAVGHIKNAERRLATERKLDKAVANAPLRIHGDSEDPTFEALLPAALAEVVDRMDPGDRQAVHLMAAGFRTGEIADILGITAKAASMRLRRARDRLRQQLATGEEVN